MRLPVANRRVHYWITLILAVPALLVIGSGLLLQVKKFAPWVQPAEQRGRGTELLLSLPQVLEIARTVSVACIETWDDIHRIDVRPARGMLKVSSKNHWEIQLDTQTGAVLQVAYRRSDLIESIHDGSWFHSGVKYGVFLPAGVLLLVSWVTGIYMFWQPLASRRRRARTTRSRDTLQQMEVLR